MNKCKQLLMLLSLCSFISAQTTRIELPITLHDGLGKGIAEYAMNGLAFVDDWSTYTWKDIIPYPQQLPTGWSEVRVGVEFLNQPQFIYQHTKSGDISEGYMQAVWLENAEYSEMPIRTYLLFAAGLDAAGNRLFVVDRNNNGNLRDDPCFYADSMVFEKGRKEVRVVFDVYINGQVELQERTMYLGYNQYHQMYFGKVAEYATCKIKNNTYMLSSFGYDYMRYEDFEVIPLSDTSAGNYIMTEIPIRRNDYLEIDDDLFAVKGVDVSRSVLILEQESRPKDEVYALQTGFKPCPLSGTVFASNDSISLAQYLDKTLLLMVFSPGCGSCIEKIPAMNELYQSLDRSKADVLALAIHTDSDHLTSVREEYAITFPLIMGEQGKINEGYIRLSTPTFLLINPDGVITLKTFDLESAKKILLEL